MAISMGLTSGPFACSSKVAALPSQDWTVWKAAFQTVGAERPPVFPATPTDTARLSVPLAITLWHELQETVPSLESLGSKKRFRPRWTFSAVVGLSAGADAIFGSGLQGSARAKECVGTRGMSR